MSKIETSPDRLMELWPRLKEAASDLAEQPANSLFTDYLIAESAWKPEGEFIALCFKARVIYELRRWGRCEVAKLLAPDLRPSWADRRREFLRSLVDTPGPPLNELSFLGPRYELASFYRESVRILSEFRERFPNARRLFGEEVAA